MPGIVGLITKRGSSWAQPQLETMLATVRHERFYRTGSYSDEPSGLYVAWTALENSFADGMPLCNEDGTAQLIFSGEDFPEPGSRKRLETLGHKVKSSAADYLVHTYEEENNFPASLNGRFHGVAFDRHSGTVTLFNDRYGMHAVYYYEAKDAFYFAAEVKAILAVCPELRVINPRSLGEFVSCGCVLEDRTLFRNVFVLPPGSRWIFRAGILKSKNLYFKLQDWEQQEQLSPEAYYQQVQETFCRNLSRYFSGGQRIGMSLTGGLDTRMIMAWQNCDSGSLPCYTFGGSYRDCRDVIVARRVAAACQQPHQVITVDGEFLARFPHYAERSVYLTDGGIDVSRSPALYANEKARDIAPVRMAGIYGSEVIRWLPGFKPMAAHSDVYHPELLEYVQEAEKTYSRLRQGHPVSFVLFQQAPQRGVNTLEESQLTIRSPYLDNDFVRTVFRAPDPAFATSDVFSKKDVSLRLISEGCNSLRRISTDRGLAGNGGALKAALRRSYLEFTFKAEYAYDYGMPQAVARIDHALSAFHLERLFLGRHKFYHFRIWYRDALSSYIREMLLDPRTLSRPYLNTSSIEAMVQGHVKGIRNYTTELHKLLTLELIHRLFLDAR